jgi:dTDP-4-amino-4,6-dideoxygalactose transaminase
LSGNGMFTQKCHDYFQNRYGFRKCLLTTSCTDALEMACILVGIKPGDEIIVPSYTFVSSANAFVLRGANIVFADSRSDHPGIDESRIESLITAKTKALVIVHYAGFACDMDKIIALSEKYGLFVIEDAAQAIDSYYKEKPLGGIGHLGCFSFHETKNLISGEGGMLVVNDDRFLKRAEIIWEKGTNRTEFFRGEVNKYGWVDIGSSFLPSEMTAAFLFAQLELLDLIQKRRGEIWNFYYYGLRSLSDEGIIKIPVIPPFATNNYHMFYIVCESGAIRTKLIEFLKVRGILAVFHYLPLHLSDFYKSVSSDIPVLSNSEYYSDNLLRLPFYYELTNDELSYIINEIKQFFSTYHL